MSHAPKHLWPGDAQQQPRKLDPLDTQGLTDEAVERLKAIDHVRGRLVRHQRRYDRMVGQLLTRMQVGNGVYMCTAKNILLWNQIAWWNDPHPMADVHVCHMAYR